MAFPHAWDRKEIVSFLNAFASVSLTGEVLGLLMGPCFNMNLLKYF